MVCRSGEALDTDVLGELKPGQLITIKELGLQNKRRALVDSGAIVGWISLVPLGRRDDIYGVYLETCSKMMI